jgi:homopolymeric O-antigen transport system ATP-binding protein
MADNVLEVSGVYKKFRRGELYGSLRDLVPAMVSRVFRPKPKAAEVDLDKRDFWALRDVSFEIKRGEAFAIIGGNGAGKSTLLKLLTGIMRPTHGTIRVAGRISALIEVSAGFHPDLTGRENVFLNGAILGMTRDEIKRRFDEIVAFSGLEEFIDTPVKRYSSGMFARLGFSVAAHVDPDVLLVDEVLSVGDYLFQRKCVERMNAVIAGGATVVFVSHNLRAVANLCPRSLLLERGQVQLVGPTEEVIRAYYKRGSEPRLPDERRKASITEVVAHDDSGTVVEIESGSKLRITVRGHAQKRIEDMSIVIQIVDDNQYPVFDTCTQRLGAGPLTLEEGDSVESTFEVDLSLAEGTFHVNAYLHRYLTDWAYDTWLSAATFFVTGAHDVRGLVTLYPRLLDCRISSSVSKAEESPDGG